MNIRKKAKTCLVVVASMVAASIVSGCSYGISETIALVRQAEAAKQAVERTNNLGNSDQSVGTVADPNYKESNISINSFSISYDGKEFTCVWNMESNKDSLTVQVFADTDTINYDGVKIASFSNAGKEGQETFTYPLEEGDYYCYIKVSYGNSNPVYAYCADTIAIHAQTQEGELGNVSISVDGNHVVFSWDMGSAEKCRAVLMDMDKNAIVAETIVIEGQARIEFPSNMDTVLAAVASYDDGIMGPYTAVEITNPNNAGK